MNKKAALVLICITVVFLSLITINKRESFLLLKDKKISQKKSIQKKEQIKESVKTTASKKLIVPKKNREETKELKRMREKLKNNIYLPLKPGQKRSAKAQKELKDRIILESKIRKGKATKEEEKEYFSNKIRAAENKIEIIDYIINRTGELKKDSEKKYLSSKDIKIGKSKIKDLKLLISSYKKSIKNLND